MIKKIAAIVAISLLSSLGPELVVAQTAGTQPSGGQQDAQTESPEVAEFKKTTDTLRLAVDALPKGQPNQESFKKRLDLVTSTLEQYKLDKPQIAEIKFEIETAEKNSKEFSRQIEQLKAAKPKHENLGKLDLVDLRTRKAEVDADIETLRNQQKTLQGEDTSYQNKKVLLGQQQLEIAQQLETLGQAIASRPEPTSLPEKIAALETDVNQLKLSQQRTLITLQEQKWETYKQFDMSQTRMELVDLKLTNQQALVAEIDAAINGVRQREANDVVEKTKITAEENSYKELVASEAVNVRLAANIGDLELEASKATNSDRQIRLRFLEISSKYDKTVKTIKQIKQSSTIGAMLRKRKTELPTAQSREELATYARDRVEEIQAGKFQDSEDLVELSLQTIREEVKESNDEISDDQLDAFFAKKGELLKNEELQKDGKLVAPAERLIERRKVLIGKRDKIYDRLFNTYVDFEANNSRVADLVERFNGFINERILWLRSSDMLLSDFSVDKADKSLLSVDKWEEIKEPALASVKKRPWLTFIGGLVLLLLLVFRSRMRREVDELGQKAARGSCATFWPTGRTIVLTTLIAITVPLIVYGIGWELKQSTPSQSRLFDAIAVGLVTAGLFAIPFEILRRACRADGLAVKHFNWPGNPVAKLKFHLSWYTFPASTLVFAVSMLARLDTAHRNDLIERILFIVGILMTAWLFHRVLSPTDGIFSQYLKRNENSWVNQTKTIWISAIVLIPISLAVLAFTGYYYTALNLTYCLSLTFAFAVALEIFRAAIRRLVTVRQRAAFIESAKRKRQVEIEAAKEARKQAAAERQRRIDAGEALDDIPPPVAPAEALAELQFDFSEIKVNADHANQLIRLLGITAWFFGLWMVWGDVLPAMKVLDEYKIWGTTAQNVAPSEAPSVTAMTGMPAPEAEPVKKDAIAQADSETADTTNADSDRTPARAPLISLDAPEDSKGVSVRDLLVGIAIVVLTFVAARNLPNAFEMLFLEDLPFDRSARSASKALFSYGIVIFGTVFVLRTLSINWTNVQWLVTALTFGLAFGLQEIFANFVAGIILMFERPMRLGDLITVDEFTGFVTRIRTRATTVVNWDRKEYVIPNKDFITGRLINWTLSDAINRIDLTVGVAYGSDVAKAKKILFDICKGHPSIVDEPPTQITFEEFGDSTLNLVVRTYLNEVLSRLPVIDSLHMQINDKFNEAGIEIAFPQQDLHLKSVDEDLAKILANVTNAKNDLK